MPQHADQQARPLSDKRILSVFEMMDAKVKELGGQTDNLGLTEISTKHGDDEG